VQKPFMANEPQPGRSESQVKRSSEHGRGQAESRPAPTSVSKSKGPTSDTARKQYPRRSSDLTTTVNPNDKCGATEQNNSLSLSAPNIALWLPSQSNVDSGACTPDFLRHVRQFVKYGNFTMAYTTLQPGMNYFESQGGYIAYNSCMGATCVLGDPVAPSEARATMIDEFVRTRHHVCFYQISQEVGSILSNLGWYVNEFGADMELELKSYDFEGPKKAKLRQAARKIEREGYRIEERTDSQVDPFAISQLCVSWLATKTVPREGRFLARPFSFGFEPGVRKFYLINAADQLVAFVIFDPICEAGRVIGYSPAVKRRSNAAPVGAEEAIVKHAIEQFRGEGIKFLRLGLMPLFDLEPSMFPEAVPLRKFLQWIYRYGDSWIYNFHGHADFKHRYRGRLSKVYVASRLFWGNAYYLIAMMRLSNLL